YWERKHKDILSIPSIHVMGDKDPFLHKSRLLAQCSEPSSATVMQFNMGHHFPVPPADTQRLANRIIALHENYQRELGVEQTEPLEIAKVQEQVQVAEISVQA
ncbi:MAG: hypothetical protein Q9181_007971, partial [Wetmoreana brouardii]